jgi:hypothetical protein
MLSKAKHLAFSSGFEVEILRLSPQDDMATQSPRGEGPGAAIERGIAIVVVTAAFDRYDHEHEPRARFPITLFSFPPTLYSP